VGVTIDVIIPRKLVQVLKGIAILCPGDADLLSLEGFQMLATLSPTLGGRFLYNSTPKRSLYEVKLVEFKQL